MFGSILILATIIESSTLTNEVDHYLASASPTNGLARFIDYPASARKGIFTPNPNFWARGIDWSCASPWNDRFGNLRAGTLISRRHAIFATHFPIPTGTRLHFVDHFGVDWPYRIEKIKAVDKADITIALLSSEVNPAIRNAKILPANYSDYIGSGEGLPVASFNQKEELPVMDLVELKPNLPEFPNYKFISSRKPRNNQRIAFHKYIQGGDSGNPVFLILNGEPVLIYTLSGPGNGSGPAVHLFRHDIQRVMDELCPGYKLEEFDFNKARDKSKP